MGLHRSFSILSTRGLGVYRVTPARASSLLEGGPRAPGGRAQLRLFCADGQLCRQLRSVWLTQRCQEIENSLSCGRYRRYTVPTVPTYGTVGTVGTGTYCGTYRSTVRCRRYRGTSKYRYPHWQERKESLSKPVRGSLPKHGRARRRVRTKNHSLRGARGGRRRRLRGRRRGLEGRGRLRRAPRGQGCPARALEGFRGRPRDRRNLAARAAGRPGGRPSPARRARFLGDARDLRRGAAAARRRRAVRVRPPREMCTRRPKSRLRAAGRRAGDALESVRRTGPAEALGVRAAAL